MKIYFHLNLTGFSNCYIVANEKTKEALIIDPGIITESIIDQLESNSYKLVAVLVTHNHGSHVHGLKTLTKIYTPKIYGADWEIAGKETNVITGNGKIRLFGSPQVCAEAEVCCEVHPVSYGRRAILFFPVFL